MVYMNKTVESIKPYIAEINIDEALALQLLQEQFPALKAKQLTKLGQGWDNVVYLLNDEIVFRFPQRKMAVPLLLFENKLLPQIIDRLSLDIPNPIYIGKPGKNYPFPFMGYKKISGISGCQLDLSLAEYHDCAKRIGRFLRILHDINIAELDVNGIKPVVNQRINKKLVKQQLLVRWHQLEQKMDLTPYNTLLQQSLENIADLNIETDRLCLIHGDLYHRHLFFNNRHLTAVLDWGDMAFSHYICDVGIVYQFLPPEVHAIFFAEYGAVPEELLNYARFLSLYIAITLIWYGIDINDTRLVQTSFKTLVWLLPK